LGVGPDVRSLESRVSPTGGAGTATQLLNTVPSAPVSLPADSLPWGIVITAAVRCGAARKPTIMHPANTAHAPMQMANESSGRMHPTCTRNSRCIVSHHAATHPDSRARTRERRTRIPVSC